MSLYVNSVYNVRVYGGLFVLSANDDPSFVAPVVVGVRQSQTGSKTTPQIDKEIVDNFAAAVKNMDNGILNESVRNASRAVLEAIRQD